MVRHLYRLSFCLLALVALIAVGPTVEAQDGKKCVSDCDCPSGELCSPQSGTCQGVACNRMYAPVCGLDGNTYGNACTANAAHVVVAYEGECKDSACKSNADCNGDQYCGFEDGKCAGKGVCMARPQVCTREFDPVCGCDMKTYPNACNAAAAGVSVKFDEECPGNSGEAHGD